MTTEITSLWSGLPAGLDLTETITARTFVKAPAGAPADPAAVASISIPPLPHISLALPAAAGGRAAASTRPEGADLDVSGVLGEGGMGRVLLARQRSLAREVAVKVVKSEIHDDAVVGGLLAEAVITGSLEHPNIIPVHALGRDDDGRPVLVMKRVEGVSWRELARDEHHAAWARIDARDDRVTAHLEILMQVCNAIHFAHLRGYVHRDLKPANVMIGSHGEVYVVDWGIATRIPAAAPGSAAAVGTPAYMAPEMVWGDAGLVDVRTDVYLLGATLHNVLTGEPRHEGDGVFEVLLAARESPPYPYGPEVPAELAAICNKATSAAPADRYPTALAFRRALSDYLRHRGSIALADGAAAQLAELRAAPEVSAAPELRAAPEVSAATDSRRMHRLMTECRFGFTQALRAWPENQAARAGLSACLDVMIDHELAQHDREGAAALIAELPEPRPDLERRLAALDAELRDKHERDARLRRMEEDRDPAVGARQRLAVAAALTVAAVALAAVALSLDPRGIDHRDLVIYAAVLCAVLGAGIIAGRKRLMSTAYGRIGIGIAAVWGVTTLGHRLVAARMGTPVGVVLNDDLVLTGGVLAAGALALPRWFRLSVFPCAAGTIGMALLPDLGIPIFVMASILTCALMTFSVYRTIK
jgi:serine/threonine-protein kinase